MIRFRRGVSPKLIFTYLRKLSGSRPKGRDHEAF
jgi:hypothetical protein